MNAIVALSDTSYMIPYSDFKIINWTLKENDNFLYWKSAGIYVCFVFCRDFDLRLSRTNSSTKSTDVRIDTIFRVSQQVLEDTF